ncbi:MarR family winged helix-turn-helix transcriptional regulator [Marinilactibacillus sp. GCM10026970]|uniref:MarR family winged helix-turn-helix transcriptional regulator n=1 Tax=Marinilactibacillus sp. GCM10026970 TaxID=3252642 RepID=UPI003619F5F0
MMRLINRTTRLGEMYRNEKMKQYGLKGMHHTYILNICNNPGVTQEKLAEIIYVNKSNVTRQLTNLEKAGYVTRSPDPKDGRKLLVYPTDKAREVYPKVAKILKEWNEMILDGFSIEEQELLLEHMSKIMNKAKAKVDKMDTD